MNIQMRSCAMYTIKVLLFLFNVTAANSFLSIISIFWVVSNDFAALEVFQTRSFSAKYMFALPRVRKDISKTIFSLVSALKSPERLNFS